MPPYFDLLLKYFPELSKAQTDRFAQLWDFYHEWNARINLISRKDIDELYLRHVLHSLAIAKFFSFNKDDEILDVGTGGGFPGIPLSIYFEKSGFTLIDSIGKKIKVVREAIHLLQLDNVEAVQGRAEDINKIFDVVVSRAVAQLPEFISWVKDKINRGGENRVNGIIYLKGGDLAEELANVRWSTKVFHIHQVFNEPFFETKKIVYLGSK